MKRLPYILLIMLLTACSSIDCPVNSIVETIWEVYDDDGLELSLSDTLTVTTVTMDGNEVVILNGKDNTVLNKLTEKAKFNLPISYSHPEDILLFHFDNSNIDLHVTDTVWIKKDDYPHFESVDCNTTFFHTLTNVRYTRNYIDSIVINNPSVTYDSKTVHFYLYPKSDD